MIYLRRVAGSSMAPRLHSGQLCVFVKLPAGEGDIVLASVHGRQVVKCLYKVGGKYHLAGTDPGSSSYTVDASAIKARLLYPRIN